MFRKKYIILTIIFVVALFFASYLWLTKQPRNLEVDFLDVGQGDAILIKSPFGQNILIDGGPDSLILKRLGENLPWWERTIDLIILTHPHDDHIVGFNEVLKRYEAQKIIYTGIVYDSPVYASWQKIVKDYQIPVVIIDRPQTINLGDNCNLEILYPRQAVYGQGIDNLNNSSLVAKLACNGMKILLMGDAEQEEEKELVQASIDLSADIIKVSHHGSDTASSDEFLARVKPQYAIIEAGKNDFGLPSLRVIKRLERLGAKVYRTDQNGTIIVKNSGSNIEVSLEQ